MTSQARRRRIAELTALVAGLALFLTSLGGIASVDRTLSASAPVPPPATGQVRFADAPDARPDCPYERGRDADDV